MLSTFKINLVFKNNDNIQAKKKKHMDFFTKKVEVKNNLHLLFSCISKKILKVLMHAFLVYNHIKLTD